MIDLQSTDLFDLLLQSISDQKFFFESKDKKTKVLCLGKTQEIAFQNASTFTEQNPDKIIWSSMTFANTQNSIFYTSFFSIIETDGVRKIFINDQINDNVQTLFLSNFSSSNISYPQQTLTTFTPDFSSWKKMIDSSVTLFKSSMLTKIVLKRECKINFKEKLNPLSYFQEIYNNQSETYNIYCQVSEADAFISFSPEKLFSIDAKNQLQTISLAGSTKRGSNEIEDQELEDTLRTSPKLILEQKIVTDEIVVRLNEFCQSVEVSPLSILKLNYIQHRANLISAFIHNDTKFTDIILKMHPTPAVGGTPTPLAISTILELEGSPRNQYAAPIGFATKEYTEWAVGLRSVVVKDTYLNIYAGCGIVSGSDASDEWIETEIKMSPFINSHTIQGIHV